MSIAAGMAVGDQVTGEPLWALVPGNMPDADRINLVFASWGWEDQADFETAAANILSWDGRAYLIGESGQIVTDSEEATGAHLGVFAIEPWAVVTRPVQCVGH